MREHKYETLLIAAALMIAAGGATGATVRHASQARPAVHPGPAIVRAFVQTALQHLKGPARRPFLNLLKSLPPPANQPGVIISTKATKNMSCSGGVCTPTAAVAVLNVNDVARYLAGGSLTVNTTSQAPDVFVNAPFSWTSANGLTLEAIGNIIVNKAVSDAGPAPLTLNYNVTGSGGMLSFGAKGHISFFGTSNPLTINGQSYLLANNIQLLAQLIARNPSGNFALSANYNAKHDGTYSQSPIPTIFQGNFEGLGNGISNVHLECSGCGNADTPVGLVQTIGPIAYWGNLHLTDAIINYDGTPTFALGGLVGHNQGTLWHDAFNGTVSSTATTCVNTGGLVGGNDGQIWYSNAAGTVSAFAGGGSCGGVGGLVGWNAITTDGSIHYSSASASVAGSGSICFAGGLVGGAGLLGISFVEHSYATGAVTLASSGDCLPAAAAGGLIGVDDSGSIGSTILSSSATGAVAGADSHQVGGLVGYNFFSELFFNTAEGAVSGGQDCSCGGAIGADHSDGSHTVSGNLSYGTVIGGSGSVIGGFIGDDESLGELSNDGWCTTSSGIIDPSQGAGNIANDPGISPFTC